MSVEEIPQLEQHVWRGEEHGEGMTQRTALEALCAALLVGHLSKQQREVRRRRETISPGEKEGGREHGETLVLEENYLEVI